MAYTVFRSDRMHGTDQRADTVAVQVQDASGNPIEVENGTIVEVGALIDHDLRKATLATASSKLGKIAIVATPEVMYDEHKHNLDEFVNKAGDPAFAYILKSGDEFSITADGFVGGTAPAKEEAAVGCGASGKISASGTGLGTVLKIEPTTRYTYYCIHID